jgi:hypothetical protein
VPPSVEGVRRRIVVLTAACAAVWWVLVGRGAIGVLAGGTVVLASVWLLEQLFRAAIVTGRRRLAMALTFAKLAAFLGLGWIAFTVREWAPDPLGFAVGVSVLPVAALWEGLNARRR